MVRGITPSRTPPHDGWAHLKDEVLLDVRLCDLKLRIEGSPLERRIKRLYQELARRGLRFRPHCWLSNEWFAPRDVPGIAIPFYLAHPRLARLEDHMMLEVEGGAHAECMRLLRHEAGHAYETAYRLGRRKSWEKMFGRARRPYPRHYRPRPFSRNYVLHLDWWYAQSHPCEDFAETFAVWLAPGSRWRRLYDGWPAMKKLRYVDELMSNLGGCTPPVRSRRHVDSLRTLRMTLREHYAARHERYGARVPDFYDHDLRRLFPGVADSRHTPSAAACLRRMAPRLHELVSSWTGEYRYTVHQVLREMITRCRELGLHAERPESELFPDVAVMLTVHTMNFVYSSDHQVAI